VLIHVVDAAGVEGRDPLQDFAQINEELRLYQPALAERPQVVALNKIDLIPDRGELARLRRKLPVDSNNIFAISAATREQIQPLLQRVATILRETPDPLREAVQASTTGDQPEDITWPVPPRDPDAFTITEQEGGFRVQGEKIERLVSMLNFAQPESLDRLQRVLERSGISQALRDAGVQEGDTVFIERAELVWNEELDR
jgi:GTPase